MIQTVLVVDVKLYSLVHSTCWIWLTCQLECYLSDAICCVMSRAKQEETWVWEIDFARSGTRPTGDAVGAATSVLSVEGFSVMLKLLIITLSFVGTEQFPKKNRYNTNCHCWSVADCSCVCASGWNQLFVFCLFCFFNSIELSFIFLCCLRENFFPVTFLTWIQILRV